MRGHGGVECLLSFGLRNNGDLSFAEWVSGHPDSFAAKRYDKVQGIRQVEKTWNCIVEFANRALELFKETKYIFERKEFLT